MSTGTSGRLLRGLWRAGGDFLYPPCCALCDCPLERRDVQQTLLCDGCFDNLKPERRASCQRCGRPVGPYLDTRNGCLCRNDKFAFERIIRYGIYAGELLRTCLLMKNRYGVRLTLCLADLMWDEVGPQLRETDAAAVVPVPRHWTQWICRSHHAALTLARSLAGRLQAPFQPDLLTKRRRTARQAALTPDQRRKNLRRAFSADLPERLRDKTLLLVDDVLTTGSTAHECSRALQKAGAGRIIVAVLARGLGR